MAEKMDKLNAICQVCGHSASFTNKIIKTKEVISNVFEFIFILATDDGGPRNDWRSRDVPSCLPYLLYEIKLI